MFPIDIYCKKNYVPRLQLLNEGGDKSVVQRFIIIPTADTITIKATLKIMNLILNEKLPTKTRSEVYWTRNSHEGSNFVLSVK